MICKMQHPACNKVLSKDMLQDTPSGSVTLWFVCWQGSSGNLDMQLNRRAQPRATMACLAPIRWLCMMLLIG